MRKVISILILVVLTSFGSTTDKYNIAREKAKFNSSAFISSLIGENFLTKYYSFDTKKSYVISSDHTIFKWTEEINKVPSVYFLCFRFRGDLTVKDDIHIGIYLDTLFRLIQYDDIIDSSYLCKKFISKKTLNSIATKYNFKNISSTWFMYDSIPNKKTVRPHIVIRNYVRSIHDTINSCIINVDTCISIDPITGDVLKGYLAFDRIDCL